MAANISFEEFQGVQTALFEWAESYDTKDWARLHKILAPELRVDYRAILGKIWESMPSEEFVTMMSHENVLGSPTLKTQHFVGASVYERVTDTEIIGYHQMRVPHQKYKDAELSEIEEKGHAHGYNQHWYKKIDNTWKFAGLSPKVRWTEHGFEKIALQGRNHVSEN
ncbi:Scytalone dehydratase [Dactylonectria macrodidyma]|uniref:Scytalone dehydratase n=1 Tax=Dactylonectria macrodidyma TaxID=307937 RepID=A0A9P9IU29_9HYPO|nr:Scytalone dehydratase [Dactylonectria macrodidyma]